MSSSEKGQREGEKGKGCKDGKGKGAIRSIQDIFAHINLKLPGTLGKGENLGWFGDQRAACLVLRLTS